MHDLPLVVFTILSQLILGGFVTLWWLDRAKGEISRKSGLSISISLLVIAGISLIVSMLHLGQPLYAPRAILNFKVSWLSREIVFYGAFVGLILIYTWFWFKEDREKRMLSGWIASIIGGIAIFSSAKIYMIPSIPAWNGVNTLFTFFFTSVLLGPLFVAAFLTYKGELSVNISVLSIYAFILTALVAVGYFSTLLAGLPEAVETARLTFAHGFFWARIMTFILAFGLLLLSYKNSKMRNVTVFSVAFVMLFISEFLGRYLFYETAVHL